MDQGVNRDGSQTFKEEARKAASLYRRVIALREAETDNLGRAQLKSIALRLRTSWIAWHGDDLLHKMSLGEPQGGSRSHPKGATRADRCVTALLD
jgi:hypothetical protein